VFRPAQEAPEIARQTITIGAKVLWLQLGIVSEEALSIAAKNSPKVPLQKSPGMGNFQLAYPSANIKFPRTFVL
jgi:uncharacterized protein